MKFLNYPECRYEIASLTSGANSTHEAVFGDCRSEQQIFSCFIFISSNFYWPHILKGRVDGMHLQSHLLIRRRFSRFFRRDFTRHDSESDKIVSPHWVVVVNPLEYTWRQQVENLKNTHWTILRWFFLLKKVPVDWLGRTVFFFCCYHEAQQAQNLVLHFWSLPTK